MRSAEWRIRNSESEIVRGKELSPGPFFPMWVSFRGVFSRSVGKLCPYRFFRFSGFGYWGCGLRCPPFAPISGDGVGRGCIFFGCVRLVRFCFGIFIAPSFRGIRLTCLSLVILPIWNSDDEKRWNCRSRIFRGALFVASPFPAGEDILSPSKGATACGILRQAQNARRYIIKRRRPTILPPALGSFWSLT